MKGIRLYYQNSYNKCWKLMVSLKYVGKINCFIYYFIVSGNVPLIVSFFRARQGLVLSMKDFSPELKLLSRNRNGMCQGSMTPI